MGHLVSQCSSIEASPSLSAVYNIGEEFYMLSVCVDLYILEACNFARVFFVMVCLGISHQAGFLHIQLQIYMPGLYPA